MDLILRDADRLILRRSRSDRLEGKAVGSSG
jgi:hypothetical protein